VWSFIHIEDAASAARPLIEAAPKTEGSLAFDANARETGAGRS
jgi:hypothetical protein